MQDSKDESHDSTSFVILLIKNEQTWWHKSIIQALGRVDVGKFKAMLFGYKNLRPYSTTDN